ncbi:DUF4299 family protein [Gulosibacter sp. 10]|uniref:DUF4299 family protein n=1 Tax=Gulosibacter sp. 10 TaxID=1255570 RepID=UPI00097F0BEB|nr:DUF4299 family protein [Gulosibacter sp. 10]SJM47896.1 hypothetical protein FM112_00325 [Gulosibacter sp. 10]
MSVTFTVTPKTRLLRPHEPMTVGEALALGPEGLRPFRVEEEALAEALSSSLRGMVLHLGIEGVSGRGFELAYEDGAYAVRELTPATPADWRIALDYLAALARHVDRGIECENGSRWSAETIAEFDWRSDIEGGLQVQIGRDQRLIMEGMVRPVHIAAGTLAWLRAQDSPADAFGALFDAVQREPGYDAKQQIVQGPDGRIVGIYVLPSYSRTVLPKEPSVAPELVGTVDPAAVAEWRLALVVGEADGMSLAGEAVYAEAIARIPERRRHDLDANAFVVEELSEDEIRAIAG